VPHPPGTPLYVFAGHAWARALGGLASVGTAHAANLLSAACTAAAGGLLAAMAARWTGRPAVGLAAALAAGTASSVWLNATETEVYAASLLHSALLVWCADRRALEGEADDARGGRWSLLLAYAIALAPAVHLSALVAAPAAIARATWTDRGVRRREAAMLVGVLLLAGGVGTGAWPALAGGAALLAAAALAARRSGPRLPAAAALTLLLGTSALAAMYVRARFDPGVNQGDPRTLDALLDVVWRRQYEAVPLWPRRAPLWLQVGNLFEYADWQWALGVHGGVAPSWSRTPVTLLYAALGVVGGVAHRRAHRASWRAAAVLLASASLGVVLYLNLKAGPSYGAGFLPEDAVHEARERDYFFALAFWTWGAWAGAGGVALAARARVPWLGLGVAALPALLNWRAVDRSREPNASIATAVASSLLRSAPPRAVLLANGDNDSYPLWYFQQVEGVRPDVVVVTVPLLGARWYRAELARRWALTDAATLDRWRGEGPTLDAIARAARGQGRPLAASVAVPAAVRASAGRGRWARRGMVYVDRAGTSGLEEVRRADSAVTAAIARDVAPLLRDAPRVAPDGAPRVMLELLRCPSHALGAAAPAGAELGPPALLDSACNLR